MSSTKKLFAAGTSGRKCEICGKGGSVWAIEGRYVHDRCRRNRAALLADVNINGADVGLDRKSLLAELEMNRQIKQHARPKSNRWYAADTDIERITKSLYTGRSIDLNVDLEVESDA